MAFSFRQLWAKGSQREICAGFYATFNGKRSPGFQPSGMVIGANLFNL